MTRVVPDDVLAQMHVSRPVALEPRRVVAESPTAVR